MVYDANYKPTFERRKRELEQLPFFCFPMRAYCFDFINYALCTLDEIGK
jgi:hypothetical protein